MKSSPPTCLSDFVKTAGKVLFSGALSLLFLVCIDSTGAICEDKLPPGLTQPPGHLKYAGNEGIIEFPFDVYRGDIHFPCKINGHDVHMLLDDGFHWDQLLFWGGPEVDSLGLNYEGEIDVGRIPSRTASGVTVGFPGVELTDQEAIITPYASGTSDMWEGSVGQISTGLLKHFIVDINFDKMMITLHPRDNFEYRGNGVSVSWEPMGFGPWAIPAKLKLSDGREISLKLMMDLGYNDQLQLAAGKENNIIAPKNASPASLGFNIEGIERRGYEGVLPWIEIGGYKLNDVPVSFVSEEHSKDTFSEAMIGLGLLSRFNLVFDYYNQQIFVEPNGKFAEKLEN